MAKLLACGVSVAVLARDYSQRKSRSTQKNIVSAQLRIERLLTQFESQWGKKLARPTVIRGDLNTEAIGLDPPTRSWIAENVSSVIHSAASLSFKPASQTSNGEPYRTNVAGTNNLIKVCRDAGISDFHYVSTAYVCGLRSGSVHEIENDCGQQFSNDYEHSKCQAEQLVRSNSGWPSATIYRPSIVIDSTGLSPVTEDRTVYGAYSLFQTLSTKFGLPQPGEWFLNLGFSGNERKNLVEAEWVAESICRIFLDKSLHGKTYHLTDRTGTSISELERAFYEVSSEVIQREATTQIPGGDAPISRPARSSTARNGFHVANDRSRREMIDAIAAPFVETFRPYFRDDPHFNRRNIDSAISSLGLKDHPSVKTATIAAMIRHRIAIETKLNTPPTDETPARSTDSELPFTDLEPSQLDNGQTSDDPIVVVGRAVRLPAGVDSVDQFEELLFEARSALGPVPESRFDRELYFDKRRGQIGKSYTQFGGCVSPEPLDSTLESKIEKLGIFDLTHRQFAQVAVKAWTDSGLPIDATNASPINQFADRCGIFVGHSGGTDQGGPLAMATLADAALDPVNNLPALDELPVSTRQRVRQRVAERLRDGRPIRTDDSIHFDAYSAASLVGRLLSLGGIREVIDAACASSLLALYHAISAIRANRIDSAIVGGATYNNVDNLILFSQSQACSESNSSPFDQDASGLISSEGYVAITITKLSIAKRLGLPIRGVIRNVGVSSDGRGKSLWAPRTEGQQLAIRRGYPDQPPLSIDYLEAHATSTQVGDATELVSLVSVSENKKDLLVGSVKSNLGHTLEAAGLVGLVKLLISMDRGEIPPTIHFKDPTPEFEWADHHLQVVDKTVTWPGSTPHNQKNHKRRCAVNAFGIGGLNGHAVIESFVDDKAGKSKSRPSIGNKSGSPEPIAIVGRGVVLPGSFNVDAFRKLLASKDTAVGMPPTGRFLGSTELGTTPYKVPTQMGGYIGGYRFDGQPYRIPPKQVQLANPLQMMLIDAVEQAVGESDGGQWTADRQRTSVVIGTIFGGEFSNHLQIGLRLPEICRHLTEELIAEGIARHKAETLTNQYHSMMLQRHSAILDETGGFTASTLASRIAKTFDLMGGACAVDADDASGGLALLLASDQLRSMSVDTVVCGVARRSLDLVGFKDLQVRNRLASNSTIDSVPLDCSLVLPGEGVAVVMLRRLSDAIKQGQQILGVIDSVETGLSGETNEFWRRQMAADPINQRIVNKIGYLAGAHPIIRIIAETIRWNDGDLQPKVITSVAEDGFYVSASTRHPSSHPTPQRLSNQMAPPSTENQTESCVETDMIHAVKTSGQSVVERRSNNNFVNHYKSSNMGKRTIIIQGSDEADFVAKLRSAIGSPETAFESSLSPQTSIRIDADKRFYAGVIADNTQSLTGGLQALSQAWNRGQRCCALDRHLAVLWDAELGQGRVAWAFPGQGSQYSAIPQVIEQDGEARSFLKRFDQTLVRMGLQGVSDDLADRQSQLGNDVWWTQLWVLAVSCALSDSLRRAGFRSDMVFGHSFGECGAALEAGAMTTEQAIKFAKLRSEAVVMTTRERGQLLSIRATPSRVESIVAKLDVKLHFTHHNSPLQTVVAGDENQIELAKAAFAAESIACVIIPVPAAYHSPAMSAARKMLKSNFGNERLKPPRVGYFSTIRSRYVAEPDSIRNCLVDQLTSPLLYCSAVERLVLDGYRLLIDVGPSDMLTRLHRDIVGGSALCVSLDSNHHTHSDRLQLIAMAETFVTRSESKVTSVAELTVTTDPAAIIKASVTAKANDAIDVVDVTRRGRSKSNTPSMPQNDTQAALETLSEQFEQPPVSAATSVETQWIDKQSIDNFLIDLVVELTGYHPDVIDFDADLEAELGVDSIKKAQVIGELAEWASLQLDLKRMRLADFQSLADIAKLAGSNYPPISAGKNGVVHRPVESERSSISSSMSATFGQPVQSNRNGTFSSSLSATADHRPEMDAHLRGSLSTAHTSTISTHTNQCENGDPVTSLMIDFIVDQTGYSPDIIDLDADLEAELGIDSIKKAQLLGELASHFELQNVDLRKLRLADFPTLGSIRNFVRKHDTRNLASPALDALHQNPSEVTFAKKKMTDGVETEIGQLPAADQSRFLDAITIKREIPDTGTCRFGLEMVQSPRRGGMPAMPRLRTGALVVGHNRIATSLVNTLVSMGIPIHRIPASVTSAEIDNTLSAVWNCCETPHLFITTPHDDDALGDLTTLAWNTRRDKALSIPFRICQAWMQRMIDHNLMDRASLVSVVNAGGDFGFSSKNVVTVESGGLAGLTKAMLIEAWMRGYRQTPMKVIDIAPETSDSSAIDGILAELAVPSHDEEVCVDGTQRLSVRPCYLPISESMQVNASPPSRGGTWIVSGGGRGITALTSIALAEKYNLKLHLLGTAPLPKLTDQIRHQAETDRAVLRRDTMFRAQKSGENPIETWRDLEKAIEIDLTLQHCDAKKIDATYHCVDVSDSKAVFELLQNIRRMNGPIKGVIHGAGAGQDARFDRKRMEKVEKCIRAKVDGAIALAEATLEDPLEWFVGFGSISGRFGANGHTDYSLANDMLAKVIDRLRQQRPEVKCLTFHWHAWGDIGMATKPEAKLALEMIGMEFMPASDGLQHFLREFECGGDLAEVLITDRNYIRKFFPGFGDENQSRFALPMLSPSRNEGPKTHNTADRSWVVTLDPHKDRFLSEHLVGGKPTLPFVVALEMMAEAAKYAGGGKPVRMIRNAEANYALKFAGDDAIAVEVVPRTTDAFADSSCPDALSTSWAICADLRRRDGRVVELSREHFHASIVSSDSLVMPERIKLQNQLNSHTINSEILDQHFVQVEYLDRTAAVFHGEPLRTLHSIIMLDGCEAIGRLTTPSPVQLGGERRPVDGWSIPCAVMDGMLYASAMLAYAVSSKPSLPVRFGSIHLGRLPDPGEPLHVAIRGTGQDARGMTIDADLVGLNDDQLISIRDYRIHFIG